MHTHKIYTYADPYKITEASFWDEIKGCPHLCSSRALVNGLSGLYGKNFAPLTFTIEDVLELMYPEWLTETELQIKQRVLISNCIDELEMAPELRKAFKFNKNDLLKAVRFLRELGLEASQLETGGLVPEQAHFVCLYGSLLEQHRDAFSLLQQGERETGQEQPQEEKELLPAHFAQALQGCLAKRIREQEKQINYVRGLFDRLDSRGGSQGEGGGAEAGARSATAEKRHLQELITLQKWLEEEALQWENNVLNGGGVVDKVVFHGLHLFTPMRVKLIQELEKWGVEIVFLHNYAPNFPKLYQTWERVYSWVDTVAARDKNNPAYRHGDYLLQHLAPLGNAVGDLLEGRFITYDLAGLACHEFAHNTSLANYAGDVYEQAKKGGHAVGDVAERGSRPGELFYAANYRPLNEIIKMYYPELYGERHFLAFPVGQLVMSLYNMWDDEIGGLKIKPQLLAECFSTNLFIKEPGKLQEIWQQARLFFQDVSSIGDYLQRLELLAANRERLEREAGLEDLKMFSFYSLSGAEINLLKESISRLNELACSLFADTQGERIDFKSHFKKLLTLIREEAGSNRELAEEEQYLLQALVERFDNLEKLSISGSLEDLKESVHYYLKQKETEVEADSWLVKNFEQIEGDALLSKKQDGKMYHFTGLTEKNMQVQPNERLPWPLTEEFFTEGYDGKNKGLGIVFNSMKEYKNFLRYAFFFGVYYVQQPFRISFVRHEGDEEQQPWFLLDLLGVAWEKQHEQQDEQRGSDIYPFGQSMLAAQDDVSGPAGAAGLEVEGLKKIDCQAFVFCPYRFALDRALGNGSAYQNEYLCSQYYTVLFYEKVWEKIEGKPPNPQLLAETMAEVEAVLKPFFPFWKPQLDFADKWTKVKEWITAGASQTAFSPLTDEDRSYLDIKKHFIYARIGGEKGENLLLGLHRLRPDNHHTKYRKQAKEGINELFCSGEEVSFNLGEWCEVCKERETCLESYKKES